MKENKKSEITVQEALLRVDAMEHIPQKNKGCLRLLAEEMFSMCHELLNIDILAFSLEEENQCYTLRVSTNTRVDKHARQEFLSLSSDGKNAANKGVPGMLGAVLEFFSYGEDVPVYNAAWAYGMSPAVEDCTSLWTLSQYMEKAPQEEIAQEWDGMEKSIIANFADDVVIGVRHGKLEMVVTKTF